MDVKTVRKLLEDLDLERYHAATVEKVSGDEVWPQEIEDAFLTAAHLFAAVGQRKYQLDPRPPNSRAAELSGRNDIISRYIFMKTGRFRARKQVSSHIQVWAHCKRPPSSHSMDMGTFLELQTLFREHYTRSSTEFQGSTKKRMRRVVSTSNVDALKRLSSGRGGCALGLAKSSSEHSIVGMGDGSRKHGLLGTPDQPNKRYRRVISELPHSSLDSLSAFIGCDPEDSPIAGATTGTTQAHPLWMLGQEQVPDLSSLSDIGFTQHSGFQQPTTSGVCGPVVLPQSFNLGLGLGLSPCTPLDGISEHSSELVASSVPAPVLTAAAMAAMARMDDAFSSPLLYSAEHVPQITPLVPVPLASGIPGNMLSLNPNMALPASPSVLSAFATAMHSNRLSDSLGCALNQSLGAGQISATPPVMYSSEYTQAFAETLNRFCANPVGTNNTDLPFPAGDSTKEECSGLGFAFDSSASLCDQVADCSMDANMSFERKSNCAMQSDVFVPQSKADVVAKKEADAASDPTTSGPFPSGFAGRAAKGQRKPISLEEQQKRVIDKERTVDCSPEAVPAGQRSYREFLRYIRSSPSSAMSGGHIGRDSDATTTTEYSSSPPQPWVSMPAVAAMADGCPVATSSSLINSALSAANGTYSHYEMLAETDCGDNTVSDWITSLRGMLEAQGIDPSLLPENPKTGSIQQNHGASDVGDIMNSDRSNGRSHSHGDGNNGGGANVDINSDGLFSMLYHYLQGSS